MKAALALTAALCLLAGAAFAEPSSSDEAGLLLSSATIFGASPRMIARLEMRIGGGGADREREIELSIDRGSGTTKTLARIISPAFLGDMKFLKVAQPGQADSQWIKTSRGVRRLGDGNRFERIFGSDFTAEDFGTIGASGFDLSRDFARDTATEDVVAARPRHAAPYALRLIYIARLGGLVTRMEYLDAAGRVLRRYSVAKVEGAGAEAVPSEARMEDLSTGATTSLKILSLKTPAAIAERVFKPGNL